MSAVPEEQARSSQARTTGVVSVAIMFSRILGLVREIVFANLFGANRWTDAFKMAFRTPNMLRDLFAEGALSTAFVTTFTKKIKEEGDRPAWELAQKMVTLTLVFMSVVAVLGVLLAPVILRILVPAWDDYQLGFTVLLARIMYPFILVVSLAALVMGMLNAKGRFFIPALASSFFNLGSIIGGVLLGYAIDPAFGPMALIGFAAGTLIGGLTQLFVQVPALFKMGFVFKLDFGWRDSGVRKVLSLMWPAVISGSAVQLSVLLNSVFASFLQKGSITWLDVAFRLMQLPLGVFGVAVGMVTLPAVSRAASDGISPEFGRILSKALRLVLVLTLPSAVGLIILAEPVISIIYERGKFTAGDTAMAAAALQTYAIGLVFYSGIKVIQPTFYAIERRFLPMFVSFGSIAVVAGLNTIWVFVLDLGHEYLALSISVGAAANFFALYLAMHHFAGSLETGRLMAGLAKLLVATAVLAAVCLAGQRFVISPAADSVFLLRAGALGLVIVVAGAAYFAVTVLLKVEEAGEFLSVLKRRTRRR
ncbi:murein biosynthesis integral membrane protein MurJ [soil metagenome]